MPAPVYGCLTIKNERLKKESSFQDILPDERITRIAGAQSGVSGALENLDSNERNIFLPATQLSVAVGYPCTVMQTPTSQSGHAPLSTRTISHREAILQAQMELMRSHREIVQLEEEIRKSRHS